MRLAGRVVVVSVETGVTARALAAEGAAVVVVGDAEAAGRIVAEIERDGGRAAAFVGDLERDGDRAALAEMLDELFASRTPPRNADRESEEGW